HLRVESAYFEKAAKYAKPKSSYHCSISLLHGALCRWDAGNLEDAYRMSSEAVKITPSLAEAHYQFASYCAQKGEVDDCIKHLERAIRSDPGYCLKADSDEMFSPVIDKVHTLIAHLRCEIVGDAERLVESYSRFVEEIDLVAGPLRRDIPNLTLSEFTAECDRISLQLQVESYFSAGQGLDAARELSVLTEMYRSERLRLAQNYNGALAKKLAALEKSRETRGHTIGALIGIIGLMLGIPVGLKSCNALRDIARVDDSLIVVALVGFFVAPLVFLGAVFLLAAGGFLVGQLLGNSKLSKSSKNLKEISKRIVSISRRIEKLETLHMR
ncbi:hypothetical protein KAX17_08880, partial [Candidatus Bipolaricaulota bacterium]|nr:hypothetical protein [Candidatus Bipolaricaulota bacterium]